MKRVGRFHLVACMVLVGVNLLGHFLPFERASVSNDDLSWLVTLREIPYGPQMVRELRKGLDRPLNTVAHASLQKFTGDNPFVWVWLLFTASSLLALAVYALLMHLFEHGGLALLGTLFYVLLPNKLGLYHTYDKTILNVAYLFYAASFAAFLFCLKGKRKGWLAGAVLVYTLGLFWYELGFFLPVVMGVWCFLYRRSALVHLAWFLLPVLLYGLWRSNAFGFADAGSAARTIEWQSVGSHWTVMVPNLYFGRQMAKGILYGLHRFPSLEAPWLLWLSLLDLVGAVACLLWLKRVSFPRLNPRLLLLGAAMFFFFLLPVTFNSEGVLSRHTALASVGFVLFPVYLISRLAKTRSTPALTGGILLGLLLISQGNAWNQVVACRMNRAIYETLQEHRQEVVRADRVLVDQYSFAKRIPYTWVNDPHNQLDTYWGVEALLGKGFLQLVNLAVGQKKEVHVVRSPVRVEGNEYLFLIYDVDHYRLAPRRVPKSGTVLVDYDAVYGNGFIHGNRSA